MSTEDRATAAISRLSQITTELAARRELRDRAAEAARAQAKEATLKIGPVAEKVAEHLGELGRRQREAGGWATEKTLADKEPVFGFAPEEDDPDAEYARFAAPSVTAAEDPDAETLGKLAEEDETPVRPEPRREVATPAGRGRRAADPDVEDDDFSSMSTWLKE